MAVQEGMSYLHTEIRSDSDLELAQPWGYGEDEERPTFSRRPIVVGFGLLTFCAATVAVFLAFAQLKPHGFGHGHGQLRDLRTAAAGMLDLEELVDAVQADLHGLPDDSLGGGLSDLLSEDSKMDPEDAGKLLDEGKEDYYYWKETAALKKAVNWASLKTDVDWDTLWGACAKYSARGQSALTACVVCLKHAPAQVDTCMNKTAEFKKEHVFEQVDMDKSGQIEGAEREDLTSKLRRKSAIPAGEYAKLEKMADKDANGAFGPKEFKELVVLVRQHSPLSELPGMVAAFFRRADENADGAIAGEAEMGFISRAINHQFHLSGGVLGGLIKEADKSGDDRLEPVEFLHLVHMVRNHTGKAMNA
jgi:hypothetical protein